MTQIYTYQSQLVRELRTGPNQKIQVVRNGDFFYRQKKSQQKSLLSSCTILKWLNKFALLFRNQMILWDIKF